MNIGRFSVPAVAFAASVLLVSCTSDESGSGAEATSSSAAATATRPSQTLPVAAVGDALADGDTTLTVHMITTGAACDYGSSASLPVGATLVQIRAEVENRADDVVALDPVDVVNDDGSSADWPADMKDGGTGCLPSDHSDDYANWSEELPVGGPTYVYGDIAVPVGAEFLNIGGYRFEIPEDEADGVEGPELTPEVDEGSSPADESASAAVGDYICPDSGINVVDPMDCQRPDGWTGPYYVDVDPNSGAYDPRYYHEDGTAKTSWELQTKAGCDEGYITDPRLCAAVQ